MEEKEEELGEGEGWTSTSPCLALSLYCLPLLPKVLRTGSDDCQGRDWRGGRWATPLAQKMHLFVNFRYR